MGKSRQDAFGVLDFLSWHHEWNQFHYTPDHISRAAELMKEAGINFVRMDFLWTDLEPEKGKFEFSRYEHLVRTLRQHGLQILGILHYNPSWSSGAWNRAPKLSDFIVYASQVVGQFKEDVHNWEIWNEPDHLNYWQPQDGMREYSRLLKSVYPVLKTIDPQCAIVLGGLSKAVPDSLRQIYTLAGRESFDIVNIHPFVSPLAQDALGKLREVYEETRTVMKHYHDESKPIWFTEVGCPGMTQGAHSADWWLGNNPTEAQQAEWLQTLYFEALKWEGVEKIFWAFFRDTTAHFKDGTDYFGLVRNDFSLKPSYKKYQSLALATKAV